MNATVAPDEFGDFFEAVHGYRPYPWQERLARQTMATGWPERISAPTGAGKACVLDVHVFACAATPRRLPRRMSVVVDRRAIVDQHEVSARRLAELLASPEKDILVRVRDSLLNLYGEATTAEKHPLAVYSLRGGTALDHSWVDDPLGCQIICATPQMWGSRALMQGYGSRPAARPRAAGLLTHDAVVVIDEAHLNRQLTETARCLSSIVAQDAEGTGVRGLDVVELSATLPPRADGAPTVSTDADDLPVLEGVLRRPKPVTLRTTALWPVREPSQAYLSVLAEEIERVRATVSDTEDAAPTVGCIVSRVEHAVRLRDLLAKKGLSAEALVGRMRQCDVDALLSRGLLTGEDGEPLDVLIATQTIEVGVDLDLAGLVTELAPAATLAQRAGRVNRRGLRPSAEIVVVAPEGEVKDFPPYLAVDLDAARTWVEEVAQDPAGMTAERVRDVLQPPPPSLRRPVLSRPNRSDVILWAKTDHPLFEEVDLSFWLLDDLEQESPAASLVLRKGLPEDDADALAAVTAAGFDEREAYPTTLRRLRDLVDSVLALDDDAHRPRAFLLEPDGAAVQLDAEIRLRPGAVAVLDARHPVLLSKVVTGRLEGTYEAPSAASEEIEPVVISAGHDPNDLLSALAGLTSEEAQREYEAVTGETSQVVLPPGTAVDEDDPLRWLVLLPRAEVTADETARQVWTPRETKVLLEEHLASVGARAHALGRVCGLSEPLAGVLRDAGLWHDRGKDEERFQAMLGSGEERLAKSRMRSFQEVRRRWSRAGLPVGWRHEQLSAAMAAAHLEEAPHRDLTVRLVGTSHGHGRGMFAHGAAVLLAGEVDPRVHAEAVDLFDDGGWDELVDSTDKRYGYWFTCYLEALVRAADAQVSKEGS